MRACVLHTGAFGLCMQVNFEEFGQTRTYDLCPNGGEVPVTKDNRNEYVRRGLSHSAQLPVCTLRALECH